MARKFWEIGNKTEDPIIDDSNDHIFEQEVSNKFAIVGSNRSQSRFIVRNLNNFGNLGGFKKIQQIIENKTHSPEFISKVMQMMGKLHATFYRRFALEYLPGFT
jgi:hypothetical protein